MRSTVLHAGLQVIVAQGSQPLTHGAALTQHNCDLHLPAWTADVIIMIATAAETSFNVDFTFLPFHHCLGVQRTNRMNPLCDSIVRFSKMLYAHLA